MLKKGEQISIYLNPNFKKNTPVTNLNKWIKLETFRYILLFKIDIP